MASESPTPHPILFHHVVLIIVSTSCCQSTRNPFKNGESDIRFYFKVLEQIAVDAAVSDAILSIRKAKTAVLHAKRTETGAKLRQVFTTELLKSYTGILDRSLSIRACLLVAIHRWVML